ncbi:hypothetical protein ACROYT_G035643 [Oculina patagonica]
MVLFSIYVLAGAAIFQAIERQEQIKEIERIQHTRMEILRKYNITQIDAERWSKTFLSTALGNEDFLEWNFGNSFLFAMVVVTTIGYGNIVPKTVQGRLFCVLYALLGIPGTCLTLKAVGDKITELFTRLITTFEKGLLKRPHPQKVELKVAVTTIILTVFFLLPLMSLIVKVRHGEWSYIESFYFTFITLSTIGFGDYLPHFEKDADYVLVLLAFVGLAFVSSIFCSINTVLEQYGVSVRVLRSLREKNASKSINGKTTADDSELLENKNKSTCDANGVQDATFSNKNTEDLQNNLKAIGEEAELAVVPLSNRNSLVAEEEVKMEYRKRGSSISLGMFRC